MPAEKLTPANVKTLPAQDGKRTEWRDTLQPGLGLRVSPNGTRVWVFTYNHAGRTVRYRMGPLSMFGVAQARMAARGLWVKAAQGGHPQQQKAQARDREALTVGGLAERYLEAAELRPATRREWVRLVAVDMKPLAKIPAGLLDRATIRDWARRIAKRAPYVGNRAFEVLRRVYSWAVSEDLLTGSPFVGLVKPATEKRAERVLSAVELRALLTALDGMRHQKADALRLLLLTVARRSMVMGARKSELELEGDDPRWMIPGVRMKSGRPHVVPLSKPAVAIFRGLVTDTHECLFPARPARGKAPRQPWALLDQRFLRHVRAKAQEALGATFPAWTVHSLRHTAATHLREDLGVGQDVVGALLAHARSGDATPIYLRAELLAERRAALVAWAAWLDRLRLEQPGTANVLPHRRRKA